VLRDLRRHATAVFALGAVLALVGSFLPWALVPGGAAGMVERTAIHGDGALTAGLAGTGLVIAIFGLVVPGRRALLFGMLLTSGAALAIAVTVLSKFPADWRVGVGLWMVIVGCAIMLAGLIFFAWTIQRAPPDKPEGPLPILRG
jgi:hypothetical protein